MIILISGASHTGKTLLAQKLLEKYKYPVLSIDLLKMGLIRSNNTSLTPEDDEKLEKYLWPIVREMIKTAYLRHILFYCLVMTRNYIRNHFADIKKYADIIEKRFDDTWFTKETALKENIKNLELCKQNNCCYILIDDRYDVDIEINRPETFSVVP